MQADMFPQFDVAASIAMKASKSRHEPTLRLVRRELFEKAEGKATACPCCARLVKIYRRALNSGMGYALVAFVAYAKSEAPPWVMDSNKELTRAGLCEVEFHGERVLRKLPAELARHAPRGIRGDFHKLRFWGFIDPVVRRRGDSSTRNGMWRLTPAGVAFAMGETKAASHALFYNGEALGFRGENVDIARVLGTKFNYAKLMEGTP